MSNSSSVDVRFEAIFGEYEGNFKNLGIRVRVRGLSGWAVVHRNDLGQGQVEEAVWIDVGRCATQIFERWSGEVSGIHLSTQALRSSVHLIGPLYHR